MEAMDATLNGTAQSWRERVTSQQASGQSIRAWCREHGHHEHAFYWWRRRLGLSSSPSRPTATPTRRPRRRPAADAIAFAEVRVVDRAIRQVPGIEPGAEPLRLCLAGGRELHLPASMPLERVARLVHAIEGSS